MLEGPHLVAEALDAGLELTTVLATREFLDADSGAALAERLARAPIEVVEVASRLLDSLCDADSPRGILAIARLARPATVDLRISEESGIWLFLDRIQDPGNVGALARVAEALGGAGLLLSRGCADANHPRALRASAGSLLRLTVAQGAEPDAVDRALGRGSARPTWVGLEAHGGDRTPESVELHLPLVLALGSEGQGLDSRVRSRVDTTVTLPLSGRVESLNVAVAGALVLYALTRRRGLSRP